MKVKTLIEKLKQFNQEAEVLYLDEYWVTDINHIFYIKCNDENDSSNWEEADSGIENTVLIS